MFKQLGFLRLTTSAVLVVSLALAPTMPAQAHAQLLVSTPAAGSVVYKWPSTVTITFDDDLIVFEDANQLVVTDSKKRRVDAGISVVTGASLSVSLKKAKRYGKYTVTYRVISADGHPVSQSYPFYFKKKR
jgi:methionine-rich copper-binding protein CopC